MPNFWFSQKNVRIYSPKESALALTVWVPLVRVALISLVYLLWSPPPPANRDLSLVGRTDEWDGRDGAYFVFRKSDFLSVFLKYVEYFFSFFLNVFSYQGEWFYFFLSTNKPKIVLGGRQWTLKSTLLARLTSQIWPFLGSKKFWTFSKFLRVVLEVFGHRFES